MSEDFGKMFSLEYADMYPQGYEGEDRSPLLGNYAGRKTDIFALTDFEPSRTSQEFAEESDINNIMARYIKTGTIPVYLDRGVLDGDMHELTYHDMQNFIAEGNSAFAALPAVVRAEFNNDAAAFIDFAMDENNRPKLREWGMLSPEAIERLDAAEAARVAAAADKPPAAPDKPVQGDPKPANPPAPTQ